MPGHAIVSGSLPLLPFKTKEALIFAIALIALPSCFAQDAVKPEATEPAKAAIPLPKQGDPLFAALGSNQPQTVEEKFMDYAVVTFGPRALFVPAVSSGIRMIHPPKGYPHEWRDGIGAYGRIYGSRLATRTAEQTARFVTAAVLHEDFRYRPSSSKNALVRSAHALAFTFVDRSDKGNSRIAFSNFAASAAAGFTPNVYMPAGYDTMSRAETRMAVAFGNLAVRNLTREFAPDLFKLTRKLHLPFPRIPIPEWWTRRQ